MIEKVEKKFLFAKINKRNQEEVSFDFELVITYTLEHQELTVNYQVENTGKEEMYFGIGGHPAFNVPFRIFTNV